MQQPNYSRTFCCLKPGFFILKNTLHSLTPTHQTMVVAFFYIPGDLQRHILHQWVAKSAMALAKVLSKLDVACCERGARPALLHLTFQSHETCTTLRDEFHKIKAFAVFMRWLQSRQVPWTCVYLTGAHLQDIAHLHKEQFTLTSTHTIEFAYQQGVESVLATLALFPNVTSISGHLTQSIAKALNETPTKLKALHFNEHYSLLEQLQYAMAVCTALEIVGHSLEMLNIRGVRLDDLVLTAVQNHCPNLLKLDINGDDIPAESFVALLHACKHLQVLNIHQFNDDHTEAQVDIMLNAGRASLREVAFYEFGSDARLYSIFANLLERHQWLECFSAGPCSYNRLAGHLRLLFSSTVDKDGVDRIFAAWPLVVILDVDGMNAPTTFDRIIQLPKAILNRVTDLTIRNTGSSNNFASLLRNLVAFFLVSLKKLTWVNLEVHDQCLLLLTNACFSCPLEYLRIEESSSTAGVTDVGVSRVIAVFGKTFKEIHLDHSQKVTTVTLQAILDHAVVFKMMSWRSIGFTQGDITMFRDFAKQRGKIPVPVLSSQLC